MCSPQSSGEGPGDAAPRVQTVDVENLLLDIDKLIGPEPTGDHSDDRDVSTWEKTHPLVSPTVENGERPMLVPEQSQPRPSLHISIPPPLPPPPPPRVPPVRPPRTKKKSGFSKAWEELKEGLREGFREGLKSFAKKFLSRGQAPHKLSDGLAPEREEEAKRYNSLFQRPPNFDTTRI